MSTVNFEHNVERTLRPGRYQYRANVGTGGITVEVGNGEGDFQPMIDGVFTADSDGTVLVTNFPLRVQLTGTAEFRVSPVPAGS